MNSNTEKNLIDLYEIISRSEDNTEPQRITWETVKEGVPEINDLVEQYLERVYRVIDNLVQLGPEFFISVLIGDRPAEEVEKIVYMLGHNTQQYNSPYGQLAGRFIAKLILDIEQFMSQEPDDLRALINELAEGVTPERRKEIETTMKSDIFFKWFIYGIVADAEALRRIRNWDREITENELLKALNIDYENSLLEAAAIADFCKHTKIDMMKEYTDRINEYMSAFSFDLTEDRIQFTKKEPTKKEPTIEEIREKRGIKTTKIPPRMVDITVKGYRDAVKIFRSTDHRGRKIDSKANLLPIIEGVEPQATGALINAKGIDITEPFTLQLEKGNLDGKINGIENVTDFTLLRVALSVLVQAYRDNPNRKAETLYIDVKDLIGALYNTADRHETTEERTQKIIKRIKAINNDTMGTIVYPIKGPNKRGYYPAIVFIGANPETQTIAIQMPYFDEVLRIARDEKRRIETENRDYNALIDAGKKRGKKRPEEIPVLHDWIKPELYRRQNNTIAVSLTLEILQCVVTMGYEQKNQYGYIWHEYKKDRVKKCDKIPHKSVIGLIHGNRELRLKLATDANPRALLDRVFNYVWKYLKEYTLITEKYPAIMFPGHNLPDVKDMTNEQRDQWRPGKKNIDTLVFEFKLLSKGEQIQRQKAEQ